MNDPAAASNKSALRAKMLAIRAGLGPDLRAEASRKVAEHFFAAAGLAPDKIVAAYWPIREELDTRPLLTQLIGAGQRVCLPVPIEDNRMEFRLWAPDAPLHSAGFGTLAPSELAPRVTPDVILLPLLAFDGGGTRLGYGGGYYDRAVAAMRGKPWLIGLGFAAQEVDLIPRERHDLRLDAVITEHGWRGFG